MSKLMTWGEFKRLVEAAGATDETGLYHVELIEPWPGEKLRIEVHEDNTLWAER